MLLERWKIPDSQGREKRAVTCRSQRHPLVGTNCSIRVSPISRLLHMKLKVTQSCPALCDPINHTVHGILQAMGFSREDWSGLLFPFSRGSSQPRCPTLQADSLTAEPQGKPKNTGVGSLSLLQGIFLTQELNQGLPHCRQILYSLPMELSGKPLLNIAAIKSQILQTYN